MSSAAPASPGRTDPPSGRQYEISAGDYRATVVEVGAGLRECSRADRPVIQAYDRDAMCDGAHGAVLIPWPNRLADGHYRFDGHDYQVPLSEPEKHNAIHGFLRWRSWTAAEHTTDRVVMTTRLHPLAGYPFALDVTVDYRLTADGLTVTTSATNVGTLPAPYGCGHHPYLSPGPGTVDECELRFGAATRITTSSDRELPTGREPTAGTAYDFRTARRIGDLSLDDAFTDLERDSEGRSWVGLHGADGRTAQLWVDRSYRLIELFTGDTLSPDRRRRGLGTEPMTCPPNAFASGQDVQRLEPGATASSAWGVQLTGTS